jgi:outer membrane immunogenic protein
MMMYRNSRILFTTTTLLMLAGIVTARADEWTGLSLSAGGGYGMANNKLGIGTAPELDDVFNFDVVIDGLGGQGGFFTIGAGYDHKVSNTLVVGAFIDYDFADIDTDLSLNIGGDDGLGISANLEIENQLSIGARAGLLLTPQTLFYAKVGYARVETTDLTASIAGERGVLAAIGKLDGYFVGGGVETQLTDGFSIKAEYRYTDLSKERISLLPGSGIDDFIDADLDTSIQSIRASLNYRFGHGRGALGADPVTEPTTITTSWTGGYVGVGTGYGAAVNDVGLAIPADEPFLTASLDGFGHEGGFIALSGGFDYQARPQIVLGAFIDYDLLNLKHKDTLSLGIGEPGDGGFGLVGTLRGEIEDLLMIGGRVGYLTSPDTLVFASFGYANAEFGDVRVGLGANGFNLGSAVLVDEQRYDGYFLGTGLETRLTPEISLKAEYRYVDLGSERVTLLPGTGELGELVNEFVGTTFEPTIQTGRVSINYRFGGGAAHTDTLK